MILIEIISESSKPLFLGIPKDYHKTILDLYYQSLTLIKNKPKFVKVSAFELIRMKFIQEEFEVFDLEKIILDFTQYYKILENKEIEKVRIGFWEDLEEFIWNYLNEI